MGKETAAPKKRTLEEFFTEGIAPGSERKEYVTTVTPDEKVVSKSKTSSMVYDPKTHKSDVDSAAINIPTEPLPKQEAPTAPVVEAPKAEGPYQPLAPGNPSASTGSTLKQTIFGTPNPEPSAWERAMVGATPLLVGLLSGNKLEGAQVASGHILKTEEELHKRTFDLNKKLAELKLKQENKIVDGKPKFGETEVFNPHTGKTEIWSTLNDDRSKFLGLKAPDAAKSKWIQKTIKDPANPGKTIEVAYNPDTGESRTIGEALPNDNYEFLPVVDETTGETKYKAISRKSGDSIGNVGLVPPKASDMREDGKDRRFQEAQMNGIVKDFRSKNSNFNTARESATNIAKAADMLNKPNAFSDEGVKTFMARSVFDEKGPLSDYDLARLAGSGAIDDKMVRNIQRWRDGNRITNDDAAAMRQVLDAVYPYIKAKAMGELDGTIKAYPNYQPLGPRLKAYVDSTWPVLPAWGNPKRDGIDVAKNVKKTMAATIPDGYRKFKNSAGQILTIPKSDSQAIKDAMADKFEEMK